MKVIVSVPSTDYFSTYQSDDIVLNEPGNHYISIPSESGFVTHSVVNFYKEKESESNKPSNSTTEPNSSSQTSSSTSGSVTEHTYSLVGSMNDWDVTNSDYLLTYNSENGRYEISYLHNQNDTDSFKVVRNNSFDWELGENNLETELNEVSGSNGNIDINVVSNLGTTYLISVDVTNYKVYVTTVEHTYSLVGSMNDWDVTNSDYLLTYNSENGRYEISGLVYDDPVFFRFRVVRDYSYDWQLGADNVVKLCEDTYGAIRNKDGDIYISGRVDFTMSSNNYLISVDVNKSIVYISIVTTSE